MTNTHCNISSRDFGKPTLRALSKRGVTILEPKWLPGNDGSYANGFRAYAVSDSGKHRILTHAEVTACAAK